MGSFSKVSDGVAEQILSMKRPLFLLSGHSERGTQFREEKSGFMEVKNADDTLRHAGSLRYLDEINERIIKKPYSLVERDNDILARAEAAHHSITQKLINIFRSKGYSTLSNKFVDLFVHDEKKSLLFEVKSTENRNFRSQARKGIVQLYEYDYFEIQKYNKEKHLTFDKQYKILEPSKQPSDSKYIEFINSLELGIAIVKEDSLAPIGKDFGFSYI